MHDAASQQEIYGFAALGNYDARSRGQGVHENKQLGFRV
jgi:hypothetical protein